MYTEQSDAEISWIYWIDRPPGFISKDDDIYSPLGDFNWDLMSKLPSLDKIYSYNENGEDELQDCRKLDESSSVTILLVGTRTGSIYVLISGFLMCARLSISDLLGAPCQILNVVLASDLKTFSCIIEQEETTRLIFVECSIVSTCQAELAVLATKFNLIQGTIQYMEDTLSRIRESWENILLEMDTKLAGYAEMNPPGTVAADFLGLLLFGTLTPELETFLREDMTEKGLKRMGQSIELSYSNIQRFVIRYLHPVCQSLHFQLGELIGLARASPRFSVIGVSEDVVFQALHCSARFWSKAVELQQVIDESMKNFKAFFRWLYTEIVRRGGGEIPEELKRTTQQDIMFIAEFIRRFENKNLNSTGGGVSNVYLEKVGQYLKEEDLSQPPDNTRNIWNQLLKENPELLNIPFILPVNTKTSAVKEFNLLSAAVNKIFNGMSMDKTNETRLKMNLEFSPGTFLPNPPISEDTTEDKFEATLQSAQRVEGDLVQGSVCWDREKIFYWELEQDGIKPKPEPRGTWLTVQQGTVVVDFCFYTKDILSVLLECGAQQTLVQLPLPLVSGALEPFPLTSKILPTFSQNSILEVGGRASSRELDNIRACQMAVSGPRNVSILLFMNRKRHRIYDMQVEEEEDEEDETFNSSGFSGSTEQTQHFIDHSNKY
ncbi:anaphase-promoting complex subunit 4 isoform X3 [Eurytemora carolleeae]|uniref:anaphase-promoting complex subunit 4 isoform X3 n=1 Tax=Eurytemora carolleeae TaxID=1294199 RepID=UPI000C7788B4|nr:anaphase-promoting complex subunit 4 isoform X3 [Eurytemora carolleeae]|eukprot:XP_023337799.1 anaphase-promoting complex subunit 4-like isoform X3 [Eurytemora affinis]